MKILVPIKRVVDFNVKVRLREGLAASGFQEAIADIHPRKRLRSQKVAHRGPSSHGPPPSLTIPA